MNDFYWGHALDKGKLGIHRSDSPVAGTAS
jgi:hypothetical protein